MTAADNEEWHADDAGQVIRQLGMTPLKMEGGYCRELYRCAAPAGDGRHACGTSIYYLLRRQDRSCWHRVASDEIWFYHGGAPALQLIVHPDGRAERVVIGLGPGRAPQSIVPGGSWQTAILLPGTPGEWGLFGAAVFPGFEYADFTAADDGEMLAAYPQLADFLAEAAV